MHIYSLRYRMAGAIFVLEAIMMLFVIGSMLTYSHQNTKAQMQRSDGIILDLLSTSGRSAFFSYEFDDIQYKFEQAAKDIHLVRILLIDNQNKILVSTDFEDVGRDMIEFEDSEYRVWKVRDLDGRGKLAILFSHEGLEKEIQTMIRLGGVIALIGMILILFASLTIGYFLTRRLTTLSDKATQFANGNMTVKTNFSGKDEVAVVGKAFDQMVGKISQNFYELQNARDGLEKRVNERTQELTELNVQLKELSETDSLTAIPNRARFDKVLKESWERSKRHKDKVTLLMIDVDFFKPFNDNYGHKAGDECLQKVARVICHSVKRCSSDLAARYGGEEFAVILQSTDLKGGKVIAEKIRQSILDQDIAHEFSKVDACLTVSIGVAAMDSEVDIASDDVVKNADLALYKAKECGRNCVIILSSEGNFES